MRTTTDVSCIYFNCLVDRLIGFLTAHKVGKDMKMCRLLKLGGWLKFPSGPDPTRGP